MNDSTRLTDQQIREMLRERGRGPAPDDLRGLVLDRARSEKQGPRAGRRLRRGQAGLLLVAAILVVGGSIVATSGGERRQKVDTSANPAPPARNSIVTTSDANRTKESRCPPFAEVPGSASKPSGADSTTSPSAASQNLGKVIVMTGGTPDPSVFSPSVFDPLALSPTLTPIADWDLGEDAYVEKWSPSPDGNLLAAELTRYPCPTDVLVLRTDGTGLRRPFSFPGRSAVAPTWAPDGSSLAAVVGLLSTDGPTVDDEPAELLTWNPATHAIRGLGRPCERCSPLIGLDGMIAWSADSHQIAVNYTDLACGTAPVCHKLAVVDLAGRWRTVPSPGDAAGWDVRLVSWLDEATLIVDIGAGFQKMAIESGARTGLRSALPEETAGLIPATSMLSPDHTKLITAPRPERVMSITDLGSGQVTEPAIPPQWDVLAWSPDSKWILVHAQADEQGTDSGIYLIRVDGSQPVRRVLPGGFGVMAWIPAAS